MLDGSCFAASAGAGARWCVWRMVRAWRENEEARGGGGREGRRRAEGAGGKTRAGDERAGET